MNNKQDASTENDLSGFFQKHMVYLSFVFNKTGHEKKEGIITAFVLSIADKWFLITAGHCLRDLNNLLSEGYKIEHAGLIDSMGSDAIHNNRIPFDYEGATRFYLDPKEVECDYGCILLRPYYKLLLQSNNIKPYDETTWKFQPENVLFYGMVGLPDSLSRIGSEEIELAPVVIGVEKLEQASENLKTNALLFHGKIEIGKNLDSIKGMSGAPILGFHHNQTGKELRYSLIAVQSSWIESTGEIIAYKTTPFCQVLEKEARKFAN